MIIYLLKLLGKISSPKNFLWSHYLPEIGKIQLWFLYPFLVSLVKMGMFIKAWSSTGRLILQFSFRTHKEGSAEPMKRVYVGSPLQNSRSPFSLISFFFFFFFLWGRGREKERERILSRLHAQWRAWLGLGAWGHHQSQNQL